MPVLHRVRQAVGAANERVLAGKVIGPAALVVPERHNPFGRQHRLLFVPGETAVGAPVDA